MGANSPSSEAFFGYGDYVNRHPKFEPTPWSAKLWMLNRLDTGTLGLATDGFDVAAQLPAWRGAPAAPRGDARPKFDP
jgi:hypothetical protein